MKTVLAALLLTFSAFTFAEPAYHPSNSAMQPVITGKYNGVTYHIGIWEIPGKGECFAMVREIGGSYHRVADIISNGRLIRGAFFPVSEDDVNGDIAAAGGYQAYKLMAIEHFNTWIFSSYPDFSRDMNETVSFDEYTGQFQID